MRSLILLLLIAAPLVAETKVLPAPGKAVAVLRGDEPKSQWFVIAIDFAQQRITPVTPTVIEDGASCVIEGEAGSQCAVTRFGPTGQQRETLVVTLGGTAPAPIPPGPGPGPTPNPQPPAPTTPLVGMRVLILHETSPNAALPKQLYEALWSPAVRAYLDQKAFNRWRRFDPQAPLTNMGKEWQDLRARATTDNPSNPDTPWVVIGGASSAGAAEQVYHSGPYPPTAEEAIALLRKYGG